VRSFDRGGRTDHALNADPVDPGQQPSKEDGLARREIRTCATCGTKFSVTSDSGICPVCILLGSFGEEPLSADSLLAASRSEGSSAETEHLSIVRRFENYEVMLDADGKPIELGRGAMGVTYKAFDVDLHRIVTLKVITERYLGDEAARLRFLREARAAASLRHPNVASVFHLGRIGTVKIIDLGLAKIPDGPSDQTAISTPGTFAGTPEFASPEQFAGVGVDIRSDLYSLGVTLWTMVAREVPFRGSPAEVMHQHLNAPLPFDQLKGVPQPVVLLLEMLLEKDPAQRFQDPTDLLKVISAVMRAVTARRILKHQNLRAVLIQELSSRPRKLPAIKVLKRSIAVLPFDTLSHANGNTYFADGVQDEILSNLAKVSQLKVISRTSVMTFRSDANRNLRSIAESLGVANIVEGTVRREGKRVRLTIRLVDARTDETLWSDTYDRKLTDIFAIQSEIARNVAARLSAQLSPQERREIGEKPTHNLEAYDVYLQAKQLINSYGLWSTDKKNITKAIHLLEEATAMDPTFALAYCRMADAHGLLYARRIDHTLERRALSDAAINEAVRLRPDLAEVHLAMAWHLSDCYRDIERVRVQIAIAAKALPNNPELLYLGALLDRRQGRWEEATAGLERAATLDPRNPDLLQSLAWTYRCLRRYRDAERILDRLIEIEPNQPVIFIERVDCAFYEKADLEGARAVCEALPSSLKDDPEVTGYRIYYAMCARDFAAAKEILSRSPNEEILWEGALVPRQIVALWLELVQGHRPTIGEFGAAREQLYRKVQADRTDPYLLRALAFADVALGDREEAIQEGRRAMEMRPISEDAVEGPNVAAKIAVVYIWADQPDFAFEQLNILIRMPGWRLNYGDLKTSPMWDPLRSDPRFEKLLARLEPAKLRG
jgi:TolB-like protein/Flp pilus assembly protein TadD